MFYVFTLLLPLIVFAGFSKSVDTYTPLNLPERIEPPTFEIKTPPEAILSEPEPIVEKVEDWKCSCVNTLRREIPDLPKLNAIDFPLNTIEPKVGDIVIIKYPQNYHIALITTDLTHDWELYQGNIPKCEISTSTISKLDEKIEGYFNMDRQRLINNLTPIQKETLWNESGWSGYDSKGSVLTGRDEERQVAQFMKGTWNWLTELRRKENIEPVLLDRFNFEDSITMFLYGWDKGVVWYGKPDIAE